MERKSADIDVGQEVIEEPESVECEEITSRRDSAATSDNTDSSDSTARSEEKVEHSTSTSEETSGIGTGSGSTTSATETSSACVQTDAAETSSACVQTDAADRKSGQLPITSELSSVVETRSASKLPSPCVEESDHLAIGSKPASTKDAVCPPSDSLVSAEKAASDVGEEKSESSSENYSESECSGPKYEPIDNDDSTSSIGNSTAAVETTGGTGVLASGTSVFSIFGGTKKKISNTPEIKPSCASESKFLLCDQDNPESEKHPENVKKAKEKPVKVHKSEKVSGHVWDHVRVKQIYDPSIHTQESSVVDTTCTDIPSTLSGAESLPPDSGENTSEEVEDSLNSSFEQMDIQEYETLDEDTESEKDDKNKETGN